VNKEAYRTLSALTFCICISVK